MKSKVIDLLIILILVCAVVNMPSHKESVEQAWKAAARPVVVIDPGHGGMDGGAEGSDGTIEKDINLNISMKLKEKLEADGIRVIMTRNSDTGLSGESQDETIRFIKSRDMHERKRIIDETGPALTISIHLNSFTQDASVKGAQVFYPMDGEDDIVESSRLAAEIIQKNLNSDINTDKKRTEMAKNDVYLFQNISSPIVIAECGFLSNEEDLMNLKNEGFQEKISKSLKASISKYLKENGNNNQ